MAIESWWLKILVAKFNDKEIENLVANPMVIESIFGHHT